MTTCREIIAKGLKLAKAIPIDEEPEAAEAELGLDILQSLYRSWFSSGEFGRLTEVYTESDYTALEGDRITTTPGTTITLPTTYSTSGYDAGVGSRRAPFELASVEVVQDGVVSSYIWERSAWVELNSLTLGSDAPLAHYGVAGLAAAFAMHYAEVFGTQIGAGQKMLADRFVSAFRARRNQAAPPIEMEAY